MPRTTTNSRSRAMQNLVKQKANTSTAAVNKSGKSNTSAFSSTLFTKLHSTPTPTPTNACASASINSSSALLDHINTNKQIESNSLLLQMVKELTDSNERMRLDCQRQVADFQRQVTALHELIKQLLQGKGLENQQSTHNNDFDMRLNTIEREQRSNVIAIDGIPYSEVVNEPPAAFKKLCSCINVDMPLYSDIFCTKKNTSNDCGSIIVKVNNDRNKYKVLNAVRAKIKANGHLTLRNIGINSDQRIYVHESLTKRNYRIFREVLKVKKQKKFASVFTSNGQVFLKVTMNSQPQYIGCLNDLAAISASND